MFKSQFGEWHLCSESAPEKSGKYLVASVFTDGDGNYKFANIADINYSVKFAEVFGNHVFGWNRYDSQICIPGCREEPSEYAVDEEDFIHLWMEIPEIEAVDEALPENTPENTEQIKPTYYSGKVVCVWREDGMAYTVGKVYEFENGRVKIDNGNTVPVSDCLLFRTLDEINECDSIFAKFIPFVE